MRMKTYIEAGEVKAGKQAELAKILGISENYLRTTKAGRNGLPDAICIRLADYIGVGRLEVIAASNLVTEKDEERRKVYESCFTKAASVAAAALIIGASSIVSPPPANAAISSLESSNICIMLNLIIAEINSAENTTNFLSS